MSGDFQIEYTACPNKKVPLSVLNTFFKVHRSS